MDLTGRYSTRLARAPATGIGPGPAPTMDTGALICPARRQVDVVHLERDLGDRGQRGREALRFRLGLGEGIAVPAVQKHEGSDSVRRALLLDLHGLGGLAPAGIAELTGRLEARAHVGALPPCEGERRLIVGPRDHPRDLHRLAAQNSQVEVDQLSAVLGLPLDELDEAGAATAGVAALPLLELVGPELLGKPGGP